MTTKIYKPCAKKCKSCKQCVEFRKVVSQIDLTKTSKYSRQVHGKQWQDR